MKLRIVALLAVLALAAAACGGDDDSAIEAPDEGQEMEMEEEAPGDVPPVATVDNAFAPSMLEAEAGEEITVMVRNNGNNPHTFTIDELEVDTGVLQSGEEAEVTFTLSDVDAEYYCTVHGREIMSGTISVG